MNEKNMNEKINSMMQIPLTINQYFFEKNIDKINVTFEREEDMILLLLNIFVHNFIHDYYFNDVMIQELLTVLPKNHSLLKDYQDFPFIRDDSLYHSNDFDEKSVTPGYYEKLYEDSEKDESWKKMLDNTQEIVGGSNEVEDIDYSKIVESVSKRPNFLLLFSMLLNYIVSFLDCYTITDSFTTNMDKSNSMNAVVYNNIQSTFLYLIDFLKTNVSEDQTRALLVSQLLSLLHDAYTEYYKENNSDFFENSIDVLTSEEVFELFVMKLVTSNTEQQGGVNEVSTEVEREEDEPIAPVETDIKEDEEVKENEPVLQEEVETDIQKEVKEDEMIPPELEEVKEDEMIAPELEEIKEAEPVLQEEVETEEVNEVDEIKPEVETEDEVRKTEKNNNNLITVITQGMFLKLGIWQNIFTKLKEPNNRPSFDSISVEKITKENLEEVYSNNELLIDEIMILKPFLLDVTPSIVVSANKIDEQLLKNMNDFYQHFSIKQKGGSQEEESKDVVPEEQTNNELEVTNEVTNEVENEVEEESKVINADDPSDIVEKEFVPEQDVSNEVEEQKESKDNEVSNEVEKEVVSDVVEKPVNKKLIQNLKNVSIKTVKKSIDNLYDLLEENVVEVKNKNDTLYESAPKYKFIINDSSSNLEKAFDIYKFLNRGAFCPGGSIMNSYNNCSLFSDYVKEVGSTNFVLSFKNDERELSYGGTVLFYNDDTRYQTNVNIDFRLTVDSDIAIINTNKLEASDVDDLKSRIVYRSTVECIKNLIDQNMVISEEDLTNSNETLLKEKMQMQTFWSLLSNITHFNELIGSTVMQNMGNFLQECEGILKWGGFINKFNSIVDTSNTFIVENSVTPILRSVSKESSIIPYDADGNALRLYVQKDISSAFRSIYILLNATEGYNEHSITGYETLLVSRGDTKGKVVYISGEDEEKIEELQPLIKEEESNKKLDDLEEFDPQPEEELQNGLEEQEEQYQVVNELQEEPVVNEIKQEKEEVKEEPLLDSVVEEETKELEEKGGRSSLKKKPSKRKYNTRNKKSNKKRNKKNTKGKNSKEKKKGKSKTQKRKKVNK